MISITQVKDALAVTGAVTVVAFLAFVGGAVYGEHRTDARVAAADSAAIAIAKADTARERAHVAAADSAIARWQALAGRVDTVRVARAPAAAAPDTMAHPTLAMTLSPAGDTIAELRMRVDSLEEAGTGVVNACTVVAQDCAAVRIARDTLAAALARSTALLTAPKPFWQKWHVIAGVGCAANRHAAACGASATGGYEIW